jgi:hypothetical protein
MGQGTLSFGIKVPIPILKLLTGGQKMKIKSLLIGSAALMTASSGAYAADAIVMAEPEPVEYVRVCDVYGAGFFYIPGTETCLKFSGVVRFEIANRGLAPGFATGDWGGYTTFSRFQLNTDVRSENEWGTLRGYAEARFNWRTSYGHDIQLNQAFIEQTLGGGTVRLGKSDTPYARFLGYGAPLGPFDGVYGFRNTSELSYSFSGNGFSAIVAVLDNPADITWATDVEAGVNFTQGWGSVGVIAGYDSVFSEWGIKGAARFSANGLSAGLLVMYASGPSAYAITDPGFGPAVGSHWSALAYAKYAFSPKAAVALSAQWWDYSGGWQFTGGLDLKPVAGLQIQPEVRYLTSSSTWDAIIRVNRSF